MSLDALAWSTRQITGSCALKCMLMYMADRLDDESFVAWPSVVWLAERTEQDERTVRKSIAALVALGHLVDTGRRVGRQKNVTVWRMPKFEEHFARGNANWVNPNKIAGVADSGPAGTPQAPENKGSNEGPNTGNPQPSQICQGSGVRTPANLLSNPDKNVPRTPTKMGGDSLSDSLKDSKSAPARAIPSGSRAAQDQRQIELDPSRVAFWRSRCGGWVISEAKSLGIAKFGTSLFEELPGEVRAGMLAHVVRWANWAAEHEQPPVPMHFHAICAKIEHELTTELRAFKPATPAERASAAAELNSSAVAA